MKKSPATQNIHIIKINNCKSLSGKSTLEYQFGSNEQSALFVRVTKNSGGGWFSREWIALKALITTLESIKSPLTSFSLQSYFEGKSVNTAAFIFAALKEEGLVINDPTNPRCYVMQPIDSFMKPLNVLVDSGVSLQDEPVKSTKSASPKTEYEIPVLSSALKNESEKVKAKAHKS